MPTDEEFCDLKNRVAKLEQKPSWMDSVKPYLPEIRSLVWMAAGLISGGSATWYAMPSKATPPPQSEPVQKTIQAAPKATIVNPQEKQ